MKTSKYTPPTKGTQSVVLAGSPTCPLFQVSTYNGNTWTCRNVRQGGVDKELKRQLASLNS